MIQGTQGTHQKQKTMDNTSWFWGIPFSNDTSPFTKNVETEKYVRVHLDSPEMQAPKMYAWIRKEGIHKRLPRKMKKSMYYGEPRRYKPKIKRIIADVLEDYSNYLYRKGKLEYDEI